MIKGGKIMLTRLLDMIKPYSNGIIVTTGNNIEVLKNVNGYEINQVNDARSATFYAFGKSKNMYNPSVLILDYTEAPNSYTGLTEVFYQKLPLFVIVLSTKEKENYWNFCCGNYLRIEKTSDLNDKERLYKSFSACKYAPMIIELNTTIKQKAFLGDDNLVVLLNKYISKDNTIMIQNVVFPETTEIYSDNIIMENDQAYGIISKYLGYCWMSQTTNILISTSKEVYLDINVFSCKYISQFVKMFIYEMPDYQLNIENWLLYNGFEFIYTNKITQELLDNVMKINKPVFVYIKRG